MQNVRISLKACRVNADKKQEEWAKLNNVSLNTVFNWENGKTEPTLSQLRTISELSGVPMDLIFVHANSTKMNETKGE